MVANLIATIMVIAIHYNSKGSIQPSDVKGWNYLFQEFTLNGVARISVPFFAMLSGFFLASKLESWSLYVAMLKNKSKTLFLPYLIASIVILLASTGIKWVVQHDSYQSITTLSFIKNSIFHPVSDQFWFLRDLIILTVISPLLLSHKKIYSLPLVLCLFFLWLINYQPLPIFFDWYLLNIDTLFFFSLGGLVFRQKNVLNNIVYARISFKVTVLFLWVLFLLIRVYLDPTLNVWYTTDYNLTSVLLYKVAILLGITSLIQFSIYLSTNRLLIYLSGLTFFAFLFHLVPLSYVRILTAGIIEPEFYFYIYYPIALIFVFISAHFLAQYTPKIFNIITGGRIPSKALKRVQ